MKDHPKINFGKTNYERDVIINLPKKFYDNRNQ